MCNFLTKIFGPGFKFFQSKPSPFSIPSLTTSIHILYSQNKSKLTIHENGTISKNNQPILKLPIPHTPVCSALHRSSPTLIVGTSTCKLFLINTSTSRVEKILDATNGGSYKLRTNEATSNSAKNCPLGGITKVNFSSDGSIFVVGYGDGSVRLWSRTGILRSIILNSPSFENSAANMGGLAGHALLDANNNNNNLSSTKNFIDFSPVLGLEFSADNKQLLICRNREIHVISLTAAANILNSSSKNSSELASHSWSIPENELIVSGSLSLSNHQILIVSEVCISGSTTQGGSKYRIFDLLGRQIGSTQTLQNTVAISSCWSPNGEYVIIGLANMAITLVSSACTQLATVKIPSKNTTQIVAGIHAINWEEQLLIASANSDLYTVSIYGNSKSNEDLLLTQTSANTIEAVHAGLEKDIKDKLQTKEAILCFKVGGTKKIIALTISQIYIWSIEKMNTPQIIQVPRNLSNGGLENVQVLMGLKNFVIYNNNIAYNFEYTGRQLSQMKISSNPIVTDQSASNFYTLSKDNVLTIYDLSTGMQKNNGNSIILKELPKKLAISQNNQIAYINRAGEAMYIVSGQNHQKLFSNVKDLKFNTSENLNSLLLLCENKLIEYINLDKIYKNDPSLIFTASNSYSILSTETISNIKTYKSNPISTAILSPCNLHVKTSPFVKNFNEINLKNPSKLLRLCQMVNEKSLWSALVASCMEVGDNETAKLAYSALNKVDKVQNLEDSSSTITDLQKLEQNLIKENNLLKAIHLNIKHGKWERALLLSIQNKQHTDFVLALRSRWLDNIEMSEHNEKFKQMKGQVSWNWDEIKNRMEEIY